MIRLFVSTLRETAFDWYARLPAGTINSWAEQKDKRNSLRIFFDEDDKSTTAQLCATKQAHNDSVDSFLKRWRALAVKCPEPHSHESLTDMFRMNFHSKPRLKLVGLKLKTLGELLAVATETEAALKDHEKEKDLEEMTKIFVF